jgi:outer membrane biosynthesis protein TonB
MTKRKLLPALLVAMLAAHAAAQNPEAPALPQPVAKPAKSKAATQAIAAYVPKVKAALAKRWGDEVAAHMSEFSHGDTNVTFKLDATGAVTEFTVVANTSNAAFAKFCEQFVRETKFEKPPAVALEDGQLEIPFTFTIL